MTIDIRARVYCSLGPIISGQVSDSSVVDTGLVTTTGSVVLAGIFKPRVGTQVKFSYAKNGAIARIPRLLLVLSSFADPFRNQTTVQLGCALTYNADKGPTPGSKDAQPPKNDDEFYVPKMISASTIFSHCAIKVGVGGGALLTNQFIEDEFDYSPGYVSIMNDLLKSECYFGYLNSGGALNTRSIRVGGSGGPLLDRTKVIDIGSTGSNQVPPTEVSVDYDSKRLQPPNDEAENGPGLDNIEGDITGEGDENGCKEDDIARQKRNWEFEVNLPDELTVYDRWTNESGEEVVDTYQYIPWSTTKTTYDTWDRALFRFEVQNGLIDQVWRTTWFNYKVPAPLNIPDDENNNCSNWWWNNNGSGSLSDQYGSGNFSFTIETDEEKLENNGKPDDYSTIIMEETREDTPFADLVQACGFGETWFPNISSLPKGRRTTLIQYIYYEKDEASGITKTRTVKYVPYVQTPEGSYSIGQRAEAVARFSNGSFFDLNAFNNAQSSGGEVSDEDSVERVLADAGRLVQYGGEVRIRTEREYGLQRRPGSAERLTKALEKESPIKESAELAFADGSDEAGASTTFEMPYAPDDKITVEKNGTQITYTSEQSDAKIKAANYGRAQARLIYASNNAVSIQIAPENMPPYPFSPIHISLNNIVGQYMTNAQSWTFDANGIIASCDALYWGAGGVL